MENGDAQAHPTSFNRGRGRSRRCELCRLETAAVYCDADAAYLCERCDESVHCANFLVARHCRRLLCNRCCTQLSPLTRTGFGFGFHMPLCDACANDDADGRYSDLNNVEYSGSSTKADAGGQQQQDQDEDEDEDEEKAEEILKRWQWWLGLEADTALVPKAVRLLRRYLAVLRCRRRRRRGDRMSLRLCMAVSFFVAASASASASAQEAAVRRFERCCRVPAPVIVLASRRLSRLCRQKALETQEGFGETS